MQIMADLQLNCAIKQTNFQPTQMKLEFFLNVNVCINSQSNLLKWKIKMEKARALCLLNIKLARGIFFEIIRYLISLLVDRGRTEMYGTG